MFLCILQNLLIFILGYRRKSGPFSIFLHAKSVLDNFKLLDIEVPQSVLFYASDEFVYAYGSVNYGEVTTQ